MASKFDTAAKVSIPFAFAKLRAWLGGVLLTLP